MHGMCSGAWYGMRRRIPRFHGLEARVNAGHAYRDAGHEVD